MNSRLTNKIVALLLCMVMVLSSGLDIAYGSEVVQIAGESQQVQEVAAEDAKTEQIQSTQESLTEGTESTTETAPTVAEQVVETVEAAVDTAASAVTNVVDDVVANVTPTEDAESTENSAQIPTVTEQVVETVESTVGTAVDAMTGVVDNIMKYIVGVDEDLTYEDEQVMIQVYAEKEGIIPEGTKIKVVPILQENEETKEQYKEVAAQLNEKAEADEQVIQGFLAYDITLVDPEGNKIEPNGEVKVTMDYKKATAPVEIEDVENAEVTIHHFEEDEKGEVKEIVDMIAEEAIEAEVKVTKNGEIQKAEFVTGSFSTYTITWKSGWNGGTRQISGTIVTTTGEVLNIGENKTLEVSGINSNTIQINKIDFRIFEVESVHYAFKKAVVCPGDYQSDNQVDVTSIVYSDSDRRYKVNSSNGQVINNSPASSGWNLYFIYDKVEEITTVDSNANHINIHVHDYSIWTELEKSWGDQDVLYDVNNGHPLKFVTTGYQLEDKDYGYDYNLYTGGSTPKQGIVKYNLDFGYPYLKVAEESNESLQYLFENGYAANKLFKMVDGYYVYDSASNFAKLDLEDSKTSTDETIKEFTVYDKANKGFFPFNEIADDIKIEEASTSTGENHHFGMNIDFTFMQPKEGMIDENNPMTFEFSGDDDVWVFIDGMLVLDLGGIHQATGGTINFATGVVDYTNATNTSIYAMYVKAWQEKGYDDATITSLTNQYFVKDGNNYRFKDYSQHTLHFFYLERGAHDTNCKIKFNLISIPQNSIFIGKEITKSNMADFADVEFTFKIEKKDVNANGTYPDQSTILANTPYKLYEVDARGNRTYIGTGNEKTDAKGQFVLKHRQVAEFANIPASTKYCVTEVGVSSSVYDKVTINGAQIQVGSSTTTDGETKKDYVTGDLLAQDYVYVTFENECKGDNLRNLIINKLMAEGQEINEDENFDIKVEFKEGNSWIPYVGEYHLNSSTGTEGSTNEEGIISLEAGQSAYILGLISGTEYKVTEVLNDTNYLNPTYSATVPEAAKTDLTVTQTGDNAGVTGKIEVGAVTEQNKNQNHKVTVTNTRKTKTVNVIKNWVDGNMTHETDTVYVGLYKKDGNTWTPTGSPIALTNNNWIGRFTNLDINDDYDVKELVPVSIAGDFTIDGIGYIAVNENGYYPVGTNDYKVSYTKATDTNNEYTTTVTVTNTLLKKVEVEKVWSDGENLHTGHTIYIGLYENGEHGTVNPIEYVALNEANDWTHVFRQLDVNKNYEVRELVEVSSGGQFEIEGSYYSAVSNYYTIVDGTKEFVYDVIYDEQTLDTDIYSQSFTIKNERLYNLVIDKINGATEAKLAGAKFKLQKWDETKEAFNDVLVQDGSDNTYTVETDNEGFAIFNNLEKGKYKLVEIQAPDGYSLPKEEIIIDITDNDYEIIKTVKNYMLYELPQSGGVGIYVPMIGGVFLMMAAALILFKNKYGEVL